MFIRGKQQWGGGGDLLGPSMSNQFINPNIKEMLRLLMQQIRLGGKKSEQRGGEGRKMSAL